MVSDRGQILASFADLFEYPRAGLADEAQACRDLAAHESAAAAALLDSFLDEVIATEPGRLEELYSGAFELDAACHPYVGHHLFGETYRRSRFMAGLLERYHAHTFEAEGELPDHLAVILRFLAVCDDRELADEIVGEALLPALSRMTADGVADSLYRRVLLALRLVLEQLWPGVEECTYETDAGGEPALATVGGCQ